MRVILPAPISNPPSKLIDSAHAAATPHGPAIATADTYGDESLSSRVQEGARTVCTIVGPVLGMIPIAGSPLKAAVGALLEILNAADVSPDQMSRTTRN
jgi:hypothetical protein